MKITYINPNSTVGMTESIVATARSVMPEVDIVGLTNSDGPAAIQGKSDGLAKLL